MSDVGGLFGSPVSIGLVNSVSGYTPVSGTPIDRGYAADTGFVSSPAVASLDVDDADDAFGTLTSFKKVTTAGLSLTSPPERLLLPASAEPSAWSEDWTDPLQSVHQHILETKLAASALGKKDRARTRHERRRRRADEEADRVADLARSMEVDRSKVAQKAFENMIVTGAEHEQLRRERWRQMEGERQKFEREHDSLREQFHRRDADRQRDANAEKERVGERLVQLERLRQQEMDKERTFYKERDAKQVEHLEVLQREALAEVKRLRDDIRADRDARADAQRGVSDKLDTLVREGAGVGGCGSGGFAAAATAAAEAAAALAAAQRESVLLEAEGTALKQDKAQLTRHLTEARDDVRKATQVKEKEVEKARDEAAAERRQRAAAVERLEREKRELEELLHQTKREGEVREWKLMQDYEAEKREKEKAEDGRQRDVAALRREMDERRELLQSKAESRALADTTGEAAKERDRLAHTLKQLQHDAAADKDRARADALEQQRVVQSMREAATAAAAKLQVEKERQEGLVAEVDGLRKDKRELEDHKRGALEELSQNKWELQRAREEKASLERAAEALETRVREQKQALSAKEEAIREKDMLHINLNTQVKSSEDIISDKEKALRQKEAALKKEIDEGRDDAKRLQGELEADRKKLVEEQTRCGRLQDATKRLEDEVSGVREELGAKETSLAEMRVKIRQKDTEMQTLADLHKQEVSDVKKEGERELKEKTKSWEQKLAAANREIEATSEVHQSSKTQIEREKERKVVGLQNELEQARASERTLQVELDEQVRRASLLKTELSREKQEALSSTGDARVLQCEVWEAKPRLEISDAERQDLQSINGYFTAGLLRCFADEVGRRKRDAAGLKEEVHSLRTSLEREKDDTRMYSKDVQELQFKLREAQDTKAVAAAAAGPHAAAAADKDGGASGREAERQLRQTRRELEDERDTRRRVEGRLEDAERLRRELTDQLVSLKRTGAASSSAAGLDRPTGAAAAAAAAPRAAAAAASSSVAAAPADAPTWLVVRARADLCENRSEARTIEQSNGLYVMVQGGLAGALREGGAGGRRGEWPLSECCWERKLPESRWLYSSLQGAWKITDGVRTNGTFDLAGEVDTGSSFQCLVQPRTPHSGVLPHKFGGWCKGVTVEAPPKQLCVSADKTASTGTYKIGKDVVNGWPTWVMDMPRRYLYNTADGAWQITDSQSDFDRGRGLVIEAKHNGVLPHLISWDGGVTVSQVRPTSRTLPHLTHPHTCTVRRGRSRAHPRPRERRLALRHCRVHLPERPATCEARGAQQGLPVAAGREHGTPTAPARTVCHSPTHTTGRRWI